MFVTKNIFSSQSNFGLIELERLLGLLLCDRPRLKIVDLPENFMRGANALAYFVAASARKKKMFSNIDTSQYLKSIRAIKLLNIGPLKFISTLIMLHEGPVLQNFLWS